jgi:hypothetical protein
VSAISQRRCNNIITFQNEECFYLTSQDYQCSTGQRYYHWMSECFPRLALVKDYLDAHPSAKILFFRGDDTKQTILKMIGIDPDRIIEYTSMLTFVEHLIVPTATAEGRIIQRAGGIMNKHLRNAIREMFHIPYNPTWRSSPSVAKAPSIIIQQRSPGGARSMTNGDDLVSAVKKAYPNAVVEVFHHDETIWDAMRMHYGADLVIGPHGAGESNALFMRPGAVMLEIYMKVRLGVWAAAAAAAASVFLPQMECMHTMILIKTLSALLFWPGWNDGTTKLVESMSQSHLKLSRCKALLCDIKNWRSRDPYGS